MKGLTDVRLSIQKCIRYVINGDYRFIVNCSHGMYKSMPDDVYLKRLFKALTGADLDLSDPKTFNEKIQWLKLYDRKPEYTTMVDKYAAKKWVADRIGEEYIIPTLGVWDHFDEIDFDTLPDQFVLKCTHDCGGLVIIKNKNKFDRKAAKKKLEKHLRRNYYYWGREWPYKDVPPRIIAETFIEDISGSNLKDYKFMCFNGEVKCCFVCSDRFSEKGLHVTFFDLDWKVMPFKRVYPVLKTGLLCPLNYKKMVTLAEKLAANIPFIRVDFYEISGKIYFGELTFSPGGGLEKFTPMEWDYTLGSWIKFPEQG